MVATPSPKRRIKKIPRRPQGGIHLLWPRAAQASIRRTSEEAKVLAAPLLGLSSGDDKDIFEHFPSPGVTQKEKVDRVATHLDEIQKAWSQEAQNFDGNLATMAKKIPRFHTSLEDLKSYSTPKAVAIGPYHRNLEGLSNMQQVKKVAADHFVKGSTGYQFEEIYREVAKAAGAASDFYDIDSVQGIQGDEFADMMFLDGCFLLQFMFFCTGDSDKLHSSLLYFFDTNQAMISNDIMLLENQLPWAVIDTLKNFREVPVLEFVAKMGRTFQVRKRKEEKPFNPDPRYSPPHLLGLLCYYKTRSLRYDEVHVGIRDTDTLKPMSKTVSAIELAKISIGLKASKTTMFGDMDIKKVPLFTNIFLAPVLLDHVRACWLVNMVAFEVSMAMATGSFRVRSGSVSSHDQVVCSYLAVLAMLMAREEDVHKLRGDRIVQGQLTNKEMLDFFKTVTKHISGGPLYIHIMEEVEDYKVKWWLWTVVYEFFYNNWKTIAALLSVVSVIVSILKIH